GLIALYRAGEDVSTEQVIRLLNKDAGVENRAVAVSFLARLDPTPAADRVFIDALKSPDYKLHLVVLQTLRERRLPSAVPLLEKMLYEKDYRDTNLIEVLGQHHTPEAKQALAKYLEHCLKNAEPGGHVSWVL